MARWTDLAQWVGAGDNFGDGDYVSGEASDRMDEVRGVILHIAEGSYAGTVAWQNNPGSDVSSHFTVAKDGRIAQGVDTSDTAWTQAAGNGHWLSIENEGFHTEAPTPGQIEAAAQILARAHQVYGVPLQSTDDPDGRGLGWHGMGGEAWGGHYGCPGEGFKAARGAIIARADQILSGDNDMGMTFNERAVLYGMFNLHDQVTLDTDAAEDGQGALQRFPNPLKKFLDHLAADVAAVKTRPTVQLPEDVAAAVITAFDDALAARVAPLQATLDELRAELAAYRRAEAEAAQAEADKLIQ